MCHANVRLVSGTSAPVISSIAGRTSVPRMSTCRDPNHLTDTVRCRTAVSWMASRKLDRSGDPRHERRFARSEEHTSELQSLMRNSYAVFCLKKKKQVTICITY